MASPSGRQFLGIAARIRKALHATKGRATNKRPAEQAPDPDSEGDSNQLSSSAADLDCLFDETGIKVSLTTIEFGKFTYVLKHLASTKRIDKTPPRLQFQLGVILTLIALLILIIYIFTGTISFGWGAVVYLIAGLTAFIISLTAYRNLKSSHTLVFKDVSGNVIQSVMRRDKAVIDRLEEAVKLAISHYSDPID